MPYARCDTCQKWTPTKKDGSLWKHKSQDEVTPCDGIAIEAVSDEIKNLEKGADYEKDNDIFASVRKTTEVPEDPGIFKYTFKAKFPCMYLDDVRWHQSNHSLVTKAARKAGKEPVSEPRFVGHDVVGRNVMIYYEVKVA